MDEEDCVAEEEVDEADPDADYEEQVKVLYAAPRANYRCRGGWSRGRTRYGSRFGRRAQHQPYADSQGTAQQGVPRRSIAQGPPTLGNATSTRGLPCEQQAQACYEKHDIGVSFPTRKGTSQHFALIRIGEGQAQTVPANMVSVGKPYLLGLLILPTWHRGLVVITNPLIQQIEVYPKGHMPINKVEE